MPEESEVGLGLSARRDLTLSADRQLNPEPNVDAGSDHHNSEWKVAIFFFVVGCLFGAFPIENATRDAHNNKDYSHWYSFGRSVLGGESLYADVRNGEPEYMYPPTAAVLFYAPLSMLGPVWFVVILCLINSASWGFSAWAAMVLTEGKGVRRPLICFVLLGLAVAPYVWDIQLLGQTNLLLLALTLGAFVSLRCRHTIRASLLFGTAVSLKAFPLSAIAYFVVRREWTTVFASVFSIFALVWFFPGLVRGFDRNTEELRQWASLMIVDQSGETMAGRSSIGFTRRNQSLVSCCHRLLRQIDAGDNPSKPLYVNFIDLAPQTAQIVGYGACLLLGIVLILSCRFQFAPSPECEGLEIAMVCTLVPLCSPLAWTYFFCWLLPAWTAIGSSLYDPAIGPQARRCLTYGASIAGLLLACAITEQVDPTLQAYGVTCFGAVVLFLTLAFVRFKMSEQNEGVDTH